MGFNTLVRAKPIKKEFIMTQVKHLLLAGALCVPFMTNAASILGDSYQIDGSFDGTSFGPISDTATIGGPGVIFSSPDVILKWADGDSFDVSVEGASDAFSLNLTLSGLNFQTPGGDPVNISGASWNEGDSDYTTYLFHPTENPTGSARPSDPIVSSTASTVTVEFGDDWSGQLAADWPTLRFDVQTEDPTGKPVPDAGSTLTLLLGALGWVFVASRSRFKWAN